MPVEMRGDMMGKKLSLGFGLMLIVCAAVILVSWRNLDSMRGKSDLMSSGVVPSMSLGLEMEREIRDMFSASQNYMFSGDEERLREAERLRASVGEKLKKIAGLPDRGPADKFGPVLETYDRFISEAVRLMAETDDGLGRADMISIELQDVMAKSLLEHYYGRIREAARIRVMSEEVVILIDRIQAAESIISSLADLRLRVYAAALRRDDGGLRESGDIADGILEDIARISSAASGPEAAILTDVTGKASEYRDAIRALAGVLALVREARQEWETFVREAGGELAEGSAQSADRAGSEAVDIAESLPPSMTVLLISVCAALSSGLVMASVTAAVMRRRISLASAAVARARSGGMTAGRWDPGREGRGELGVIVSSVRDLILEQKNTLLEASGIAEGIYTAASELSLVASESRRDADLMKDSAGRAAELVSRSIPLIRQCGAAASEAGSGVDEAVRSSSDGEDLILRMTEMASRAVSTLNELTDDIGSAGEKSGEAESRIMDLASVVDHIGGFVSVISGIAAQTNLLALNAAIEASRAGDAGRGFAVVAEEVRKLADESGRAARRVSDLIEKLQESSKGAIAATEESEGIIRGAVALADRAQSEFSAAAAGMQSALASLRETSCEARRQAAASRDITAAAESATLAAVEISDAITGICDASDAAAAEAIKIADRARDVSGNSEQLMSALERLRGRN
jgi:methyl-accepting chemotaxis protein